VDELQKLKLLASEMEFEPDGEGECNPMFTNDSFKDIPITRAAMPGGKYIKLLKTLLTSACERNCYYCPFRSGRDMPRATLQPDDMAKVFIALHNAGAVEGIFLSSAIAGGSVRIQDKLIDTAEILRNKFKFQGYIHLKIMPGAEYDQVERSMQLASRISVNLEAPNDKRLSMLAPHKEFSSELVEPLKWVNHIRKTQTANQSWNGRWPSSVTQFVVGAVGESDLELLSTSEFLYRDTSLKRIYYSGFNPVEDTPLENTPPVNPQRQNRLYQSSFLLRDYEFGLEDIPFDQSGNLPLEIDPKLAWAKLNMLHNPLEINHASCHELLRIPGFGPISVNSIINARREHLLNNLSDLEKLGIYSKRAAPFILLNGKRPAYQLRML
jgi:predicted DNA-binding helix-hairpin-helix protein